MYHGTRVLVLGASGFIGRWVARGLAARGARTYLTVRDRANAERAFEGFDVKGQLVPIDLTDEAAVRAMYRELRPAITFNLAGYGVDRSEQDQSRYRLINEDLVRIICECIAGGRDSAWSGLDLVHTGSALEYGAIGGNLSEEAEPNPFEPYGRSKLGGTRLVSDSTAEGRLKGVTARLFTVYGPGEHAGRLLPTLLDAARTSGPLSLTAGTQKRDFTFVGDVEEGLLRLGLLPGAERPLVNLATGKLATVKEFIEITARILLIPSERLMFGALPARPEEMAHSAVAVDRLRSLLGWVPDTSIAEGVRRTLAFHTVHRS